MARWFCLPTLCGVGLLLAALGPASAQTEYEDQIPTTAAEDYSPIEEGFDLPFEADEDFRQLPDQPSQRLRLFDGLQQPGVPAFLRDSKLDLNSRTYYMDQGRFGLINARALTTGGSLAFESGYFADFTKLRATLFTTQPLAANDAAGLTLNLSPDGDQITTLGVINGLAHFSGNEFSVGRQLLRTPFVNPYDNKMIPVTVEGVVLTRDDLGEDQRFDYILSYLDRYKPRNEDTFISFSNGLGVDRDEGMFIGGANYYGDGFVVGAANYLVNNTLNTLYGEIEFDTEDGADKDDLAFSYGANIMDQRTVGAGIVPGAGYASYQASARIAASYEGVLVQLAASSVGDDATVVTPYGSTPNHTAMIISDFNQAGTDTYFLSFASDFRRVGWNDLRFQVSWAHGFGVDDPAFGAYGEQHELDLSLIYEPSAGAFEGLNVRVQYADWKVRDVTLPDEHQRWFRVVVNYPLSLL